MSLPQREAIVMVAYTSSSPRGRGIDPVPSLEFDPVILRVEDQNVFADPYQPELVGLMDGILQAESMTANVSYSLVWSDSRQRVNGVCPSCDDIFIIDEGAPGDDMMVLCCECID